MSALRSSTEVPEPVFAHLDYVCPFENGSDKSEARVGDKWVRVNKEGRVLAILGTFTPAPYVNPH